MDLKCRIIDGIILRVLDDDILTEKSCQWYCKQRYGSISVIKTRKAVESHY